MALGFKGRGWDTGGWFPALQQLSFATAEQRVKMSSSPFYMEHPIQSPARYQSDITFSAFTILLHTYNLGEPGADNFSLSGATI